MLGYVVFCGASTTRGGALGTSLYILIKALLMCRLRDRGGVPLTTLFFL